MKFGKRKKKGIEAENDLERSEAGVPLTGGTESGPSGSEGEAIFDGTEDGDHGVTEEDLKEFANWTDKDFEDPEKIREHLRKKHRKNRKRDKGQIIRVEDLEKVLEEHGEDISPETIVSMYMPQRRAKRLGAALLRMDKLRLGLIALMVLMVIMFIVAVSQEKMGNFTINLDRLEMYRRGISIASDGGFTDPTAKLEASSVQDATNTTLEDLPEDLDDVDGDHNGRNYVAYTYYVRNAGKEALDYKATVKIENASKGADAAARVAVYRNGKRTIWAKKASGGGAEPGTKKFPSKKIAAKYNVKDFEVGYVDKYTVVIWLEGEDPDCTDAIVGGALQFSMNIDAIDDNDTGIVTKLIQDIKDTISGDDPIGVSGQKKGPDYYKKHLNYNNRLNQ